MSSGHAVSGRIFLFQSVFSPKTFSLSRLYNGRRRQRKQATDGKVRKKDKTAYRLVQIEPNSICCYFIIWKGYFLETQIKWAGGQLRSLQKNLNPYVSFVETLGLLAPFVSVCLLVPFHQCFFYVGSPVENLAAYLCVRQNAVVAVVLQGSPAHFQHVCHFLVCQQFIAIGGRLSLLQ